MARAVAREAQAALSARISSERPFLERWVAFWSNHLCVSGAVKPPVRILAGAYEREVIRPHALDRFETLLLASVRHPAMLLYLDNAQSVGPGSPAARQAGRRGAASPPGLNENLARELLELHTVGVDGGYTQEDVRELARILTGWTVVGAGPGPGVGSGTRGMQGEGPVTFAFVPLLHDPGEKRVMGVRYPAGEEGGLRVVRDLCRHPSTARFLATKLVRHFVADDPPPSAVEEVARVWQASEGDLREVAEAVIHLDEAWDPAHRKFRTPQDWLTALARGGELEEAPPSFPLLLQQLRHPLWAPPAPDGYPDTMDAWADPQALLNRAELARTWAGRLAVPRGPRAAGGLRGRPQPLSSPGTTDDSSLSGALLELAEVSPEDPLRTLLSDESIAPTERRALAFAGPAFQWR